MKKLTLKGAQKAAKENGMTIRKVEGEYQVFKKGDSPSKGADCYYTDDLEDAYLTMLDIARRIKAKAKDEDEILTQG